MVRGNIGFGRGDERQNKGDDILIEKSGGGEKTPVGRAVIFDKDYEDNRPWKSLHG